MNPPLRLSAGPRAASVLLLAPLLLLAAGTAAEAATVTLSNAAQSAVFVRDCRSAAAHAAGSQVPDLCEVAGTFAGTLVEQRLNTQLGGTRAAVATTRVEGMRGSEASRASVDASGALGQLVIKQGAFTSLPYGRVSAWNEALQSYAWDGSGPAQRTISGSLDFTAWDALNAATFQGSSTVAAATMDLSISVFSLSTPQFSVDTGAVGAVNLLENFVSDRADYRSEAWIEDYGVSSSPLGYSASFTMEAGRTYFLETRLSIYARYGAYVDATHTFTAGFTDVQGLTAAAELAVPVVIGNVPEPASVLMLVAGLGVLGMGRRRAARRQRG